MRIRRLIAALALPVVLVGLTACGGDGDSAGDPSSASAGASPGDPEVSDTPSEASQEPSETGVSEGTEEPTPVETSDPAADWPDCGTVWRNDERLPRGYRGCRTGDQAVKADARGCSFGRPLVTYADRFWGVPSGVIHESDGPLKRDRAYRSDLASCTA